MSSNDGAKENLFSNAAYENIDPKNTTEPTSASIIAGIADSTGYKISSAAAVVDGFWNYIENRKDHWRKDTNCLSIPGFGSFIIKPSAVKHFKSDKIGKIKILGQEFIYRNKNGQWSKAPNPSVRILFRLTPKINLSEPNKYLQNTLSSSASHWTDQWNAKRFKYLSLKRKISVYIHNHSGIPLKEIDTLLALSLIHI